MLAEAHARLDRHRFRESVIAARVAQTDEKGFTSFLKSLEDTDAPARRPPKDPNRVSLAEQARRRAQKKGSTHGG